MAALVLPLQVEDAISVAPGLIAITTQLLERSLASIVVSTSTREKERERGRSGKLVVAAPKVAKTLMQATSYSMRDSSSKMAAATRGIKAIMHEIVRGEEIGALKGKEW